MPEGRRESEKEGMWKEYGESGGCDSEFGEVVPLPFDHFFFCFLPAEAAAGALSGMLLANPYPNPRCRHEALTMFADWTEEI